MVDQKAPVIEEDIRMGNSQDITMNTLSSASITVPSANTYNDMY